MTDAATTADAARLTLDAWTTAASCETQIVASQIAWNEHVMTLIERRVKIERDIALVQAMQAALVSYHRATQELERERRQLARRAEQVSRAVTHAMWILQGETINPDHVSEVWVSLRYLIGQADLAGASADINAIPCDREAANLSGWTRPRTGETATAAHPRSNIRAVVDWACRNAYMPKTGTPAAEPFRLLIAVLYRSAAGNLAELHARATELQRDLLAIRQQSWATIDYTQAPKGKQ